MIATRHGADIIAARTPARKETTMMFDDEPGKTACGLYIGSAGNGNTICETATQLFRKN